MKYYCSPKIDTIIIEYVRSYIKARHALVMVSHAGATAYSYARFGRGSGGIFLDNLYCRGTESRLIDCSHSGIGVHNCDHSADAGLRCQGTYLPLFAASGHGREAGMGTYYVLPCNNYYSMRPRPHDLMLWSLNHSLQ